MMKKIQMLFSRYYTVFLALCLLALTSCEPSGPRCVLADDWGERMQLRVKVDPKNEWTNPEIVVKKTDTSLDRYNLADIVQKGGIRIKVRGEINLCEQTVKACPTGNDCTKLDPQVGVWQATGASVRKGERIDVELTGSYRDIAAKDREHGKGLYMYIGKEIPADPAEKYLTKESDPRNALDFDVFNEGYLSGEGYQVIHLYDHQNSFKEGGLAGVRVLVDGHIYLRYARNADAGTVNVEPIGKASVTDADEIAVVEKAFDFLKKHYTSSGDINFLYAPVALSNFDEWKKRSDSAKKSVLRAYIFDENSELANLFPKALAGDAAAIAKLEPVSEAGKTSNGEWKALSAVKTVSFVTLRNHPQIGNLEAKQTVAEVAKRESPWAGYYQWSSGCEKYCGEEASFWDMPISSGVGYCYDWEGEWESALPNCAEICLGAGKNCKDVTIQRSNFHNEAGEEYDGGAPRDHWMGNQYDAAEMHGGMWHHDYGKKLPANSPASANAGGGYEIKISSGCKGFDGEHLTAYITPGDEGSLDYTDVKICYDKERDVEYREDQVPAYLPPNHPCDYKKDSEGNDITRRVVSGLKESVLDSNGKIDIGSKIILDHKDPAAKLVERGLYEGDIPDSGQLWFHIKDRPGSDGKISYGNNSGYYNVVIDMLRPDTRLSRFLTSIIRPIKAQFLGSEYGRISETEQFYQRKVDSEGNLLPIDSQYENPAPRESLAEKLYMRLVGGQNSAIGPFIGIIRVLIVVYIMIHGFLFVMGMVRDPAKELMLHFMRLGVVVVLISGPSWHFFNTYLFSGFVNVTDEMIEKVAGEVNGMTFRDVRIDPITGVDICANDSHKELCKEEETHTAKGQGAFSFMEVTVQRLLSQDTWAKIGGLVFSPDVALGMVLAIFVVIAIFMYLSAIVKAVLVYILSFIAVSFLIAVAPIFITCLLFEKTRGMFENWLKYLLSFAMQPVFLMVFLAIFNVFVTAALYSMFSYKVCYDCVAGIDHWILGNTMCLFEYYHLQSDITAHVSRALTLFVICYTMHILIDWALSIAAHITSGISTTPISKVADQAIALMKQNAAMLMAAGSAALKSGADMAAGKGKTKR